MNVVAGKLKALPQANLPLQSQAQAALNALENALGPATSVGEISEVVASTVTNIASDISDFSSDSLTGTLPTDMASTYLERLRALLPSQDSFTMVSSTGRNYCFKLWKVISGGSEGIAIYNTFEDGTGSPVFSLYDNGVAHISTIVQSVDAHLKGANLTIVDQIKAISRSSVGDKPTSFTIFGMLSAFNGVSGSTIVDLARSLAEVTDVPWSYDLYDTLNSIRGTLHPSISPMCIHFYELLKGAIQNSRIGSFFREVIQTILNSKAATFISNLLAMYSKFKEYEEVIKDHWDNILQVAMESGMIGVLNYIIDYWLNHRRLESFEGGYLKLTDNEQFRPEALGLMVWNGICSVASQVIGVISTALGPVFSAVGFVASTVLSIFTAPLHYGTQQEVATIQIDDTHFSSGSPLAYFKAVLPVEGNEGIAASFGSGIGALFPVPGGYIIGGLIDKDHIGLEFHPSFAELGYLPYEGSLSITPGEVGVDPVIVAGTPIRILTSLVDWNDYIPGAQQTPTGILSPQNDTMVWLNVRANLCIFLLWVESLAGHVDQIIPQGTYSFRNMGNVPTYAPLWMTCLQKNGAIFGRSYFISYARTTQDSLIFKDDHELYKYLYFETHSYPALNRYIRQELYGLVIPLTESFGWPLYPSKVAPGSTITAFVIANLVVAAATVASVVGFMKVRSKVKKYQANKAAAAEASWSEMTKAAAAGDKEAFNAAYKNFKKNAIMNNISASIFGGTKISPYNYWNQSSTSEANTPSESSSEYSNMLSEVLNKKDASANNVDVTLEMIYQVITGYLPGEQPVQA